MRALKQKASKHRKQNSVMDYENKVLFKGVKMAGIFKWRLPTDAELDLKQYEAHRLDNETARVYARKYILGFLFVLVVCGAALFVHSSRVKYDGGDLKFLDAYFYHNVKFHN